MEPGERDVFECMKTIIAGSRFIQSYATVEQAIKASGFVPSEVVSGCAMGVDILGEIWASRHGRPVKRFPADWQTNGRSAGVLRNIEMAKYAEALVAVWDGQSKGTKHMIQEATKRGLKVFVLTAKE